MTPPPEFSTPRLRLRPLEERDTQLLYDSVTSDPLTMRYLPWALHASLENTRSLVALYLSSRQAGEKFFYIAETRDAEPVGLLTLYPSPSKLTLGLIVIARHRRSGYGREMIRSVLDWASREPGEPRVVADCDVENLASAAALRSAGFACTGVLPAAGRSPNAGPGKRDLLGFSWSRPAT